MHRQPAPEREVLEAAPHLRAFDGDGDYRAQSRIVQRRRLLGWAISGGLAAVGASTLGFVWSAMDSGPARRARGAQLEIVGTSFADLRSRAAADGGPLYIASARCFIAAIPGPLVNAAEAAYDPAVHLGVAAGVVAFSQSCPYDLIQLPYCRTSAWFECPACGSHFSMFGEKKGGPAPRGMTLVPMAPSDNGIVIDTTRTVSGLAIGIDFSHQQAAGPHCH